MDHDEALLGGEMNLKETTDIAGGTLQRKVLQLADVLEGHRAYSPSVVTVIDRFRVE